MSISSAAKAYEVQRRLSLVEEKKPEELVSLLLQKAYVSLLRGVMILRNKEILDEKWEVRLRATEEFHMAVSKTLQILTALREVLDHDAGGDLAQHLEDTYSAIMASLWKYSKEKDEEQMSKILEALSVLKEAWEGILVT